MILLRECNEERLDDHLRVIPRKTQTNQECLVRVATGIAARAKGLLFSRPSSEALILLPCNDIHTVGMRCALDVAFIDRSGRVVASERGVRPMRRRRSRNAVAVIERFSSEDPWFEPGDEVALSFIRKEVAESGRLC